MGSSLPFVKNVKHVEDSAGTDAFKEGVNKLVMIMHAFHADILGDTVMQTLSSMGDDESSSVHVFEITCKMSPSNTELFPRVMGALFATQFVCTRHGSTKNDSDYSSSHVFKETLYHVWIPLADKSVHRRVSVAIVNCFWRAWHNFNWFNIAFDIDSLCHTQDRLYVLNTDKLLKSSIVTSLTSRIQRVQRKRFCISPAYVADRGIVTCDENKRYDSIVCCIERADGFVRNRGWIMDDMLCANLMV
eukprot:gene8441-biopygen3783